jgi:hypothetical protein
MPPIHLSDSSYDYDDSSEGQPNLLSDILKQMMGGDIELTTGSSEEGSSEESTDDSSDSVEVTVEATPRQTEIAPRHRGDGKDQRVSEEVSYRRAP